MAAKKKRNDNGRSTASAKSKRNGAAGRSLPVLGEEPGRAPIPCLDCGLCCTYIAVEIEAPTTVRRATEILWYLYHDRVSVYWDEDEDWMVQFESRCQHLGEDNKCGIYKRRPHVCREYDEKTCEVNAEEEGLSFFTPGDFLDFLRRRRKRVYAALQEHGFMPPARTHDGKLLVTRRGRPYPKRYRSLRDQG